MVCCSVPDFIFFGASCGLCWTKTANLTEFGIFDAPISIPALIGGNWHGRVNLWCHRPYQILPGSAHCHTCMALNPKFDQFWYIYPLPIRRNLTCDIKPMVNHSPMNWNNFYCSFQSSMINLITQTDDGSGGMVFTDICLSVCQSVCLSIRTISQKPMQQGSPSLTKNVTPWVLELIYFGVKRSRLQDTKNSAGVGFPLLWVLASSGFYVYALTCQILRWLLHWSVHYVTHAWQESANLTDFWILGASY